MPISALIFDLFDVLFLHGARVERRAFEQEHGLPMDALERTMLDSPVFRDAIAGRIPEPELWRDVAERLRMGRDSWQEVAQAFYASIVLNAELVACMRTLRPTYRMGILTNAPSDVRPLITGRFQLDQLVDTIVISAEEKVHKPQPQSYQLVMQRLGVTPEQCLFIDDGLRYVTAARELGMQAIHFQSSQQTITDIQHILAQP
ncbi:HAD family hydrolase [Dictyobacter aurantiacus]|uniref:Haloacid dehalogenase n=1 Tax=Dictyobacter aurantiacus TaxID=1936993 RepID=A0A401ZK09_9CHLR|nr:HAD family phosphatase [Dictyobacter aurantiacus]GCE07154.1 hypothetical protein KDAU_44830 [Dictyobacter aurantiacus]